MEETKEQVKKTVKRVQAIPGSRGRWFRVAWIAAAVVLLIVGIGMSVLPGPALLVIPIALAMLAAQFCWARKLLDVSIDKGFGYKEKIESIDRRIRLGAGLTGLLLLGAVLYFVL